MMRILTVLADPQLVRKFGRVRLPGDAGSPGIL